jgi:transcriptional regulator with XRE-family HTH domain
MRVSMSQRAPMEPDTARIAVRRQVRAERESRGWSQSDLARAAGVSRGTIANLERGMRLTEGKEAKIETALGKSVGWLDDLRSGRVSESVDFGDATVPARSTPVDPETGTLRDLWQELRYFHTRFRETPEDYIRLLALLDLSDRLEQRNVTTQSGVEDDA